MRCRETLRAEPGGLASAAKAELFVGLFGTLKWCP